MTPSKIVWTKVDEAPALATYALLPVVRAFTRGTGIDVLTRDISLAGRIIASFPENLTAERRIPDDLTALGELARTPDANIIKLPNISASIPQLLGALEELRAKGYDIPAFPEEPGTDAEKAVRQRFSACLGSAVNPVLREGNSDRRPAAAIKRFARKNPHEMMKPWPRSGSRARVAHMTGGDYFENERSVTVREPTRVRIEFVSRDGAVSLLKDGVPLQAGEIVDATVMNVAALRAFYADEIEAARKDDVLLSLHVKATMMKASDPVMFGHCVSVYYAEALEKHAAALAEVKRSEERRVGKECRSRWSPYH